ncbi:MAG: 50S ribosomal protein L15 [Bacteroidetes bacterium]|nr:50S ribosomal protein L15 [Bacteroidota bacterium]
MKHIGNLSPAIGSTGKKKRIGRGAGSGHGGTSTRGHKGHKATSGYKSKRGFEGGQMPLSRRLPKFGFSNPFRVEFQILNLSTLQELSDANLFDGNGVTPELLYEIGAISKRTVPLKILGSGELTAKLHISADSFSESAKQKIESAGGTAITNG